MSALSITLAVLLAQAQPANKPAEDTPGRESAGLEAGTSRALTGGRNDVGSDGSTGVHNRAGGDHKAQRAKANEANQGRGKNPKGDPLLRPADAPAEVMSGGAQAQPANPDRPPSEPAPKTETATGEPAPISSPKDIPSREPSHGKAGGTASDQGTEGGAETQGTAGKGAERGGSGTKEGPTPK